MANYRYLKVTSFNCCGVKNKLQSVRELCEANGVVVLQETRLQPHDIGLLDSVSSGFKSSSISAVDTSDSLVGRPYGGLILLW